MSWSIVIPSASGANLVQAVSQLLRTHPNLDPSRIVVVDDGARDEAEARLPRSIRWVAGKKPFVFSRNVNLGVRTCAEGDLVIMGDDVEVLTPGGLDILQGVLREDTKLGVISPGIVGAVGNPNQRFRPALPLCSEDDMLAFICVMIPRSVWSRVGPMDERFTGYGFDDVDYCWRVRDAGFGLAVSSRCVVRHDGSLPSVYRTKTSFRELNDANESRLQEKWNRS